MPYLIIILFLCHCGLTQDLSKTKKRKARAAEWMKIKKDLTPKKAKSKHIITPDKDRFSDIKKQADQDFKKQRRELIKANKKLLKENLGAFARKNRRKDQAENKIYLENLQITSKTNVKFWLKAQKFMKQIQAHLRHL